MFSQFKNLFFKTQPEFDNNEILIDLGEANLTRTPVGVTNPALAGARSRDLLFSIKNAEPYTDNQVFQPEESTYPPGTVLCRIS